MDRRKAECLLLFAALIGGVGILGNQYLLDAGFEPFQIITGRFFVAFFMMVLFFYRKIPAMTKEEVKGGSILGFFLFGLFSLMIIGLKYTAPSINGFLVNLQSIFVPVICFFLYRKKPSRPAFVGILLTILGMGLLSIEEGFLINLGALLSAFGSFCYALQMVLTEKYVKKFHPIRLTMIENGIVCFLAFLFVLAGKKPIPPFTVSILAAFLIIGCFSTMLYFLLQSIAQKHTSSTNTSILISSEAVFTALISTLFFGETMNGKKLAGCAFIFCAVLITELGFSFFRGKKTSLKNVKKVPPL